MSLILNIDTSTEQASVCLAAAGKPLAVRMNEVQKDHAAWLHIAIREIMEEAGKNFQQLDAVAVTEGPGSYTGLRVGLSSAKGLCYALRIPLIVENTLYVMANAAVLQWKERAKEEKNLMFCPMIDARRMEVFTAIFNRQMEEIMAPQAMELKNDSFMTFLNSGSIVFTGSGIQKARNLFNNPKIQFYDLINNGLHLCEITYVKFAQRQFASLAYTEPVYLKEFYSAVKNTQLP